MPKIEVYRDVLIRAIGDRKLTDSRLEELFPCAKAELDEPADEAGIMKVELNDTNRPDLWSTAGLARQLRVYRGGDHPRYSFFSDSSVTRESADRRVVVDPSVENIRPTAIQLGVKDCLGFCVIVYLKKFHITPFEFIEKAEPENIIRFIQDEQPQTIALILAYLNPKKAGQILSLLPEDIQPEVARRIALMDQTPPDR